MADRDLGNRPVLAASRPVLRSDEFLAEGWTSAIDRRYLRCELLSAPHTDWTPSMNTITRIGAAAALAIVTATSVAATASAGSVTYVHSGNFQYRDADVTTTIYFKSGHPSYNVLLWADQPGGSLTYSVWMYQGNTQVWSAANQSNRVYSVGSNVSRIVMTRNCACGRNGVQPRG